MAHTHYKGTGKVHSFRGTLTQGDQQKIRIEGSVGAIAWRITKFQVIGYNMSGVDPESTVKIFREKQGTDTSGDPYKFIDFDDDELLAAAYFSGASSNSNPIDMVVVFDNALFVRNIYLTHYNATAVGALDVKINYYIELEEVKVSAAGMAQLAVAAARRTID
jgi:hypothetical protein